MPRFLALVFFLAASTVRAQFPANVAADRVLGQPDFTTNTSPGATRTSMGAPSGLAVDPVSGKVFVALSGQNRILRFASGAALVDGAEAEAVIGQTDYVTETSGTTGAKLNQPYGLDIDASGRLWVADFGNHRVLMFEDAANLGEFGAVADLVLGQPDFDTGTSGTSQTTMDGPTGIHVDATGSLWVAEYGNHRVVKFANAATLTDGDPADIVLGQPDFDTAVSGTDEVTMSGPVGVLVDGSGRLWVAEQTNNRVLRFNGAASLTDGAAADGVLGQPDFDDGIGGSDPAELGLPSGLAVDRAGTLYITDYDNSRVVYHRNPASKPDGATPDGVIGQPDLDTTTGDVTSQKLDGPYGGLDFDAAGNLWVADYGNNRSLRFPGDWTVAPPRITGRVPRATTATKLPLRGTASDPVGISAVQYRLGGKGPIRTASGTTSWRFTAKLRPGSNKIEVVAFDGVGNMSPLKTIRVKRVKPRPADGGDGGGSTLPPFLIIRS